MYLLDKIKSYMTRHGFKNLLRKLVLMVLGTDKQQEEIDALYYFLNRYTDITKLGPTKDCDLRIMQQCNAVMLNIFDKMCQKYNLKYWLDWGTLLGAVRHGGFIPWDDDMDVAMPREDYDKVIPLMQEELKKYGIVVRWGGYFDNRGYMARLALAYRTVETGVWLDIFPADCYSSKLEKSEMRSLIEKDLRRYQKYYIRHEQKDSVEKLLAKKREFFSNMGSGENRIWVREPEFSFKDKYLMEDEMIYPLQKLNFEGYDLNVPADCDAYLRRSYGDTYMEYPRFGIENHRDPDGGLAKERAKKHNVDMNMILKNLKEIAEKIDRENSLRAK